jgi:hypothetical protein
MKMRTQHPTTYLQFIRGLSIFVPKQLRQDWRREWEAEIISRWQLLQKWNRLNMKNKIDLSTKVASAAHDVASLQHNRTRGVLVTLNILFALLLGFGAVQEFVVSGVIDRQLQPFILGSLAIAVSVLFIISAIAMLRQWPGVRRLVILTGVFSILVHVYGALPPHRNMGIFALMVGAGYALVMMLVYQWNARRNRVA